ncbi:MAG: AAA family ATPase [Pseudomonadota bacterium]
MAGGRAAPFSAFLDAARGGAAWDALVVLAPDLAALASCPQEPEHHREGDVAAHTRLVLQEMAAGGRSGGDEPRLGPMFGPELDHALLFWAAALHDLGKPATTTRSVDGRWTAPGHARRGAAMARRLFWEAGAPPLWREALARLIALHMRPFHLIDQADPRRAAIEIAEALAGCAPPAALIRLAMADARGRRSADPDALSERVALAAACLEEHGLSQGRWPFPTPESRAAFFAKPARDPHFAAPPPEGSAVTLLSGLPGAGKDSWIAGQRQGDGRERPVVSLDAIRARLGAPPTGAQGAVIQAAVEEAKDHLRAGRPFIWNATNLTRSLRARPLALFRDYRAAVEIVYLETSPQELFARNARREAGPPKSALSRLADRMEPPDGREAARVRWIIDGVETVIV